MTRSPSKRPRILVVDDEPDVLDALSLRLGLEFQVETARDGREALGLARETCFEVVVSDMCMPGMDGATLLATLSAETPDCSRILLTASSDLERAVDAVNRGQLFRFLTKPWCPSELVAAVSEGSAAYRRRVEERVLLEGTLEPSLQVMTELLAFQRPREFGESAAVAERARALASELELADAWEVGVAASLRSIGALCLPAGAPADPERVARVGHDLLCGIPRLEGVALILLYQHKRHDGGGLPADEIAGDDIPLGARILKLAADVHGMCTQGMRAPEIFRAIAVRPGWYDPKVAAAARRCLRPLLNLVPREEATRRAISLSQLLPGHILLEDLCTTDGLLLIAAGRRITPTLLESVRHYAELATIWEPLLIATPDAEQTMVA